MTTGSKISQLTSASAISSGDLFLITQNTSGSIPITRVISASSIFSISDSPPQGYMINGKIVPTVTTGSLNVALKTISGNNPSVSDPIYIRIGDTVRMVTAALSVTVSAATNWCNAGSAEFATKEIDYFPYLVWNTNLGTPAVDILFSRFPYANLYSDFSTTTTNEKHACVNATAPAATDVCENIGRFAASLSAGAGYTWSVPTYTAINLIQRPIYNTRFLSYNPTITNGTLGDGTMSTSYMVDRLTTKLNFTFTLGSTSSITGAISFSLPFTCITSILCNGLLNDTGTATYVGTVVVYSSTAAITALKSDSTYTTVAYPSATVPHTWAATDYISFNADYPI
jgi:hypothetical protein